MTKYDSKALNNTTDFSKENRPMTDNDLENIAFILKEDPILKEKVMSKLFENPELRDAMIKERKQAKESQDPVEKVKEKMKKVKFD